MVNCQCLILINLSFCPTGADGETRTLTACATAPSRRRVYQFHHVGIKTRKAQGVSLALRVYFGMSFAFESASTAGLSGTEAGAGGGARPRPAGGACGAGGGG